MDVDADMGLLADEVHVDTDEVHADVNLLSVNACAMASSSTVAMATPWSTPLGCSMKCQQG
jgi:hypothetical protein